METVAKVWLDYDQEALDAQYNQRSLVPDADDYIAVDVAESARVREKLDCRIDVAYGPGEDEKLDVFPALAPGSPVSRTATSMRSDPPTRSSAVCWSIRTSRRNRCSPRPRPANGCRPGSPGSWFPGVSWVSIFPCRSWKRTFRWTRNAAASRIW